MKNTTAPLLGVLGGMGPLATVDFLGKLVAETPAQRDAEHVPMLVYSVPQIPDRPAAILGDGESPLPAMLAGIRTLRNAGATCLAIACNTAHYWHDELIAQGGLPILHMADAACAQLAAGGTGPGAIGLIATQGTLAAGFYQQRLADNGYTAVINTPAEQERYVLPAIAAVKRNDLAAAHALALDACAALAKAGAQAVILACTEIPPALEFRPTATAVPCIDATRALARACVAWWLNQRSAAGKGMPPFGAA
jgi:aspartate racemase